jgi:hypothetical protein
MHHCPAATTPYAGVADSGKALEQLAPATRVERAQGSVQIAARIVDRIYRP